MSKIAIWDSVAAAFESGYENRGALADAMRTPFYLIIMAYVPVYVAGIYLAQNPEKVFSLGGGYGGGLGSVPPVLLLLDLVVASLIALVALAGAFNWQRVILKGFLGRDRSPGRDYASLTYGDYRAYIGYAVLLALPVLALDGGMMWLMIKGAEPSALTAVAPLGALLMALTAPLWVRFGLVLPAVAAGHEPRSLMAAFRLGAGNGWRIVAATLLAMLLVLLLVLLLISLGYLVLILPAGLAGGLLAAIFGKYSLVFVSIVMLVAQAAAMVIALTVSSGLMAFVYAQLHPDYDEPLLDYLAAADEVSAIAPLVLATARAAQPKEAPAAVAPPEGPGPKPHPAPREEKRPAPVIQRAALQPGKLAYGPRKRH